MSHTLTSPFAKPASTEDTRSIPTPAPGHDDEQEPTASEVAQPPDTGGVLSQWARQARDDHRARTARGGWTREQPTSVHDHIRYYTRERRKRADGRKGWELRTASPLINGIHAGLYTAYGLSVGLAVTLAAYAFAWMAQRPGRFLLLITATVIVANNLSTWLSN
jgi:hypothetical protein